MTDYYKYTDDIPDAEVIERLVAGEPDVDQLIAIISRSYDYIRNLPLKAWSLCEGTVPMAAPLT